MRSTASDAGSTPPPDSDPGLLPAASASASASAGAGAGAAALIFDDPLAQQSSDDTDQGWGERSARGEGAAELAWFLDEKPPHHI